MNQAETDLTVKRALQYRHDPVGWVRWAYGWGSGDLEKHAGPRKWQGETLNLIGSHILDPTTRHQPLRIAVASGHGIGKSACISMIVQWALSTCRNTKIVVTANTEKQLRTKTWPEVLKWARLGINTEWFSPAALSLAVLDSLPPTGKVGPSPHWRADAIAWSEHNTEAFQGLHNEGRRIVVVFDEASGIHDDIWEVTEGALTDEATEIIWIAFGNPTQATGAFRECFGSKRHLWKTRQIDSRTVETGTNKQYLDELVRTYGEDSDYVRVRVRGVFPAQSVSQFISTTAVEEAQKREPLIDIGAPLIMGVDLARMGDDQSVIRFRSGLDGKSIPPQKWRNRDAVYSANKVASTIDTFRPRAVFVDNGYIGAAVVDILHSRGYQMVVGIDFGGGATDPRRCHNKRAEMWSDTKDWLGAGGCIDADEELRDDLIGPEHTFHRVSGALLIESKEDMKGRGLASPDDGDALALTFGGPVARLDISQPVGAGRLNEVAQTEYDMFN